MNKQSKELSFEGQNIFIGIDVHKKSWQVSIVVDNVFFQTFHQSPDVSSLLSCLNRNFPKGVYYSVYEAGFSGFWLHHQLTKSGINSIVVHPADVPTTGKEKIYKDDSRDSRKLARSLSNGDLTAIHIPQMRTVHDRKLLQSRVCIVKNMVQYKLRIKGLLNFYGVDIPKEFIDKKNCWSLRFIHWLKEISGSMDVSEEHLLFLIRQLEHFRSELLSVTRSIRNLSKDSAYQKKMLLLQSVPGIGLLTGMSLLTEIEDVKRFGNIDALCNYMGLVPICHNSGESTNVGTITPRSHSLRNMLIESAWCAIRKDAAMLKAYTELCKRMHPNKAIVRIARKLLARVKHVLDNNVAYKINIL
jgi:transposase